VVPATNATSRLDEDLRSLGIADAFDVIASSAAIGHAKPDPRFYRAAVSLAGAPAADVFVVDDKRPNIEVAAALGIASGRGPAAARYAGIVTTILPRARPRSSSAKASPTSASG
jgi:putative hydrolase of the HAD superfamily